MGDYLNVDEVESAMLVAAATHPALATIIEMPEPSHEGRVCRAIRLSGPVKGAKVGFCFSAGVHAREWGNPDVLVSLMERLLAAYAAGAGLSFGAVAFSAKQVKSILDRVNLYIFPQVNPDGRKYSMEKDAFWRKNRRPTSGGIGTDLNRNFDFLWDHLKHFHQATQDGNPAVPDVQTSKWPQDSTYRGPAAHSESETRNLAWLVESHQDIRALVDVHSHGKQILYGWGDDQAQAVDPSKSFQNAAHDGQRGVGGDAYGEYVHPWMDEMEKELAQEMRAAIQAAHGDKAWQAIQSYQLYPTSGTCDDYVRSLHYRDPTHRRILAWTFETGSSWWPDYDTELAKTKDEVGAALLTLCLRVLDDYNADLCIADSTTDTGAVPSAGNFWTTPDIVVRQQHDWGGPDFESQPFKRGKTNWIYVRAKNLGPAWTLDNPVARVRVVGWAGTQFVYPEDWTLVDMGHLKPATLNEAGPQMKAGDSWTFAFGLEADQVEKVWEWQKKNSHPCILAAVDSVNDFSTATGPHVWQSNNIAQRNVTVEEVVAGKALKAAWKSFTFLAGHPSDLQSSVELLVDRRGLPAGATILLDAHQPVGGDRPVLAHTYRMHRGVVHIEAARKPSHEVAIAGPRTVSKGGVAMLALDQPESLVRVPKKPGERRRVTLWVRMPPGVEKAGRRYPLHVRQRDAASRVVGGVSFEVRAVAPKPTRRSTASKPVPA